MSAAVRHAVKPGSNSCYVVPVEDSDDTCKEIGDDDPVPAPAAPLWHARHRGRACGCDGARRHRLRRRITDEPGGLDISSGSRHLKLVAYAVPKPGFDKIIPAFRATPQGHDIGFSQSYGASGDQSRKVARRVPADVVNFSVEPDITRLVRGRRRRGLEVAGAEQQHAVRIGRRPSWFARATPRTSMTGTICSSRGPGHHAQPG